MLDPQTRLIYLEALRPPPDYILDQAIATTFSLDLLSLLMAPLSMIFSEQQDKDALLKDPIAFLEALQRSKDRLVVFCQAGRIAIPTVDTRLYSYLEPVVVEVQPQGNGVFHPKLWVLRFKPKIEDAPIMYRLLCLSRNLTFDRSWDTLLSLEGYLDDQRQRGFGLNRPLTQFIKTLPQLAVTEVSPQIQTAVAQVVDEIGRVRFEAPAEFDEITAFLPSGVEGYKKLPIALDGQRWLVISPFLSEKWLKSVVDNGNGNILISRPESLDDLNPNLVMQLEATTKIYVLDEAAEHPEEEDVDTVQPATWEDLSGLHAKLYIVEQGWQASVFTGSANATTPGFDGNNVEFLIALSGKRSRIGIDQFLGQDGQPTSLWSMLRPYHRPEKPIDPKRQVQKKLEDILEQVRRAITDVEPALVIIPDEGTDSFNLRLEATRASKMDLPQFQGRCYPISLNSSYALEITPLLTGQAITFNPVSLVGLTGFFAFELTAELEGQQASLGFVLNLPVTGMPPERDQQILHSVISDKGRFIRYLLFLLAEDKEFGIQEILGPERGTNNGVGSSSAGLPLLEELVRVSSRQPEKIDRIAKLIDNLTQSEQGQAVLPEGFLQIWDAFLTIRR